MQEFSKQPATKRKKILQSISLYITLSILGLLSMLFMYFTGRPTACLIQNTIGIPCPSCGMTRAFMEAFLWGDIAAGLRMHPLFAVVIFLPLIPLIYSKNRKAGAIICITILILFLLVYVIRMLLYFPNIEPMIYYKSGVFPFLFNKLF